MSDLLTYFVYRNQNNTPFVIDDCNSVIIKIGSEIKNNEMRVELKNNPINVFSDGVLRHKWVDNDGVIMFKAAKTSKGDVIEEELVDVYGTYTDSNPTTNVYTDDYLLFTGFITQVKPSYSNDEHKIELSCKDRSVMILDRLTIPQSYKPADVLAPDGIGWRAPTIIQTLIRNASDGLTSKQQGYYLDGSSGRGYPLGIDARRFSEAVKQSHTNSNISTNKLIDSPNGDFIDKAIAKDDLVRNVTSNTYAYVLSVDSATQLTLSKDIFTSSGVSYQISDGFIQDTRPDGTAFPVISFSQSNKPVLESVTLLSQTDMLNTTDEAKPEGGTGLIVKRSARFFIDKKNRFHWYIPSDTPEHIFEIGQTSAISPDTVYHKINSFEFENNTENNINFIVFKAGDDMDGDMIMSHAYSPFTGTPNRKEAGRTWMFISRAMKSQDEKNGNIVKTGIDMYNYPTATAIPAWDRQKRTVTTHAMYNQYFKEEAIKRGIEKAQAIFQGLANPRWGGTIQLRGETINVGDLIKFTSNEHGIRNILVRVKQVTHTIKPETGWTTSLSVEEDELESEVGL